MVTNVTTTTTTDQQGEYRAICLWKVGRQTLQKGEEEDEEVDLRRLRLRLAQTLRGRYYWENAETAVITRLS